MEELPSLLIVGISAVLLFLGGWTGKSIKLPQILFYIIVGFLLSKFVHIGQEIHFLSELGIVILFFFLGLEFNLHKVVQIAKKIWIAGLLDFFLNFLVFFGVIFIISQDFIYSFSIAGIIYASSSAIITKLIIDNRRIASPETEFVLGLMVFEDIIAPIIVAFIAAFDIGANPTIQLSLEIIVKLVIFTSISILISKFAKKFIIKLVENYINEEILNILIVGFVILMAGLTKYLNLSEAYGAFLAGLIISESGKKFEVASTMITLRDITVLFFFLLFGASIKLTGIQIDWLFLLFIVFASLITKFMTGYIGGKIYKLSNRRAFISGLEITPRGEFSIAISNYISYSFLPFASLYIILTAIIGMFLSHFASPISKKIFPRKKNIIKE